MSPFFSLLQRGIGPQQIEHAVLDLIAAGWEGDDAGFDPFSEDALADAAAPYFRNKRGEPISPRTVKYWLRGDTLPSALHLSTLVMMQPKLFLGFWLGSQS